MYIQKMYEDGITSGCGGTNYCPDSFVNRAQMAVFLTRGFLVFIPYPEIEVTPVSYSFADTVEGTISAEQVVTISNIGSADLNISDISLTGTDSTEFILDLNGGQNPCVLTSVTLSAGGSCTVSLLFAPLTVGQKSADLSIASDSPGAPIVTVSLSGTGTPQSFTMTVIRNGNGTVTSSPMGIICGGDCTEDYLPGTMVALTASPSSGESFSGWSGDCIGNSTCILSMDSDMNVTATFTQNGGGGGGGTGINYVDIPMSWTGVNYTGILFPEYIGPNQEQNFYRVDLPPACTQTIQFALAGNITAQANENMLVSNRDFGTEADAMSVYQQFLNTTGYEVFREEYVNGATYWYWFAVSYESEFIPIFPPGDTTYYIQIVNESNFTGIYRVEAYCW
jgi:hypothetical protein